MSQITTIALLVLDVDGVMSDGKVTYTSDGAELKSFNIKDGVGIKRIQKAGVQTAIITGRVSPMVERRATELGIHHLIQGREDKLAALKELLSFWQNSREPKISPLMNSLTTPLNKRTNPLFTKKKL